MRTNTRLHLIIAAAMAAVASVAAASDGSAEGGRPEITSPSLTSPWRVTVGGTVATFDSLAAWSAEGLGGAMIRLEDVLGLDEEISTWNLSASYRFNRRHSIELNVTDLSRSARRALDEEIEWGDVVYRADGVIEARFDVTSVQAMWCYDFSDSDRLNAGVTAGLSTFAISVGLQGEARLESDEGSEWIEGVVESADLLAPVPVVGFFLDYALTPRWVMRVDTSVMNLNIGDRRGRVMQSQVSLEWQTGELVGVGLSLGGTDLAYGQKENGERLGIDYRVSSIGAFVAFSF